MGRPFGRVTRQDAASVAALPLVSTARRAVIATTATSGFTPVLHRGVRAGSG